MGNKKTSLIQQIPTVINPKKNTRRVRRVGRVLSSDQRRAPPTTSVTNQWIQSCIPIWITNKTSRGEGCVILAIGAGADKEVTIGHIEDENLGAVDSWLDVFDPSLEAGDVVGRKFLLLRLLGGVLRGDLHATVGPAFDWLALSTLDIGCAVTATAIRLAAMKMITMDLTVHEESAVFKRMRGKTSSISDRLLRHQEAGVIQHCCRLAPPSMLAHLQRRGQTIKQCASSRLVSLPEAYGIFFAIVGATPECDQSMLPSLSDDGPFIDSMVEFCVARDGSDLIEALFEHSVASCPSYVIAAPTMDIGL